MPRDREAPPVSSSPHDAAERLRRLEAAIEEGRARKDAALEAWVRRMGRLPTEKERDRWEREWERGAERERQRWEKQWERESKEALRRAERQAKRDAYIAQQQAHRQAKRAEKAAKEEASRNPLVGVGQLIVALACVATVVRFPNQYWWLLFVALGFFKGAAKHLRAANNPLLTRVEEPTAPVLPQAKVTPAPADPRLARVDAVCEKLLAELSAGPGVLQEMVRSPERTVQDLRKSCHELIRRERELRTVAPPEDVQRLADERKKLETRWAAEEDAVVRDRLRAALQVLDEQVRQRAELTKAADRLEAEYTRLAYTLENLYAQVLRVRSADAADADVAGAGLRLSVEQLGAEVDAVTSALEEVHGAPVDGRVRTR
ncbi:MICOS complex subunit MIC60 [Corallococcus sp. EGB]|uniref:MICOS complex subunit MIC60 n=1 Tax=Corallococcus sp. EGB TaxID=1521117 RepID=UPI001CBF94FE|nr:MICOS complex subunit MIC60 [Corallococcus sp. EGB]